MMALIIDKRDATTRFVVYIKSGVSVFFVWPGIYRRR